MESGAAGTRTRHSHLGVAISCAILTHCATVPASRANINSGNTGLPVKFFFRVIFSKVSITDTSKYLLNYVIIFKKVFEKRCRFRPHQADNPEEPTTELPSLSHPPRGPSETPLASWQ